MDTALLHLLQTTDSAFPVGGFAHSYGLEGLVQAGLVETPASLDQHLRDTWLPMLTHVDFPLIRLSRDAAMEDATLFRIDQLAWAVRATHESRRAQQAMGVQRLNLVARLSGHPRLSGLADAARSKQWMANWPSVWGVECACLSIPVHHAQQAYGYQCIFGILTAALKLIAIGPTEVQTILYKHIQNLEAAIRASGPIAEDEIGWFSPLLDITGAQHEQAYTRIFIS